MGLMFMLIGCSVSGVLGFRALGFQGLGVGFRKSEPYTCKLPARSYGKRPWVEQKTGA